jgi:NADH dehydrogenase
MTGMKIKHVTLLGGAGFVGRHLVHRLNAEGYGVRVLTRHRERHREFLVAHAVELVETNVYDAEALQQQFEDTDAVVNLVGILNERGDDGSGFHHAHVELSRKAVEACKANGVKRLLHMSALNADAQAGPSHYLRTKGEAEDFVHRAASEDFQVTSFRPSVIFGAEDSFFNRFAGLLRLAPWFFPLACPNARFAPVYVGDVVEAFLRALADPATSGRRYDLCGPRQYTLQELVEYTAKCLDLRRRIIPLSETLGLLQARVMEHVPGKPFSLDNHRSLQVDSVCQGESGLASLGITPTSVEAIVPVYLQRRYQGGAYQDYRSRARRH